MKKLFKITLVFVLVLLVATSVKAMSKEDFISYVTAYQKIGGKNIALVTSSDVEKILAKHNLSEADLDYVKGQYDAAVGILKASGKSDLKSLSSSDRQKLINIADATSAKTGIKYEISGDKVNVDGVVITNPVKQTGNSNYEYAAIPVVAIIAVAIAFVSKKAFANAK